MFIDKGKRKVPARQEDSGVLPRSRSAALSLEVPTRSKPTGVPLKITWSMANQMKGWATSADSELQILGEVRMDVLESLEGSPSGQVSKRPRLVDEDTAEDQALTQKRGRTHAHPEPNLRPPSTARSRYSSSDFMFSTRLKEFIKNASVPMTVEGLQKMAKEGWRNTVPLCSMGAPIVIERTRALELGAAACSVPHVGEPTSTRTTLERVKMLVLELVHVVGEISKESKQSAIMLKAEQSSRVEQNAALDALRRQLAEVNSTLVQRENHVRVIWAADREIESLALQLRDCQGRAALREADLNVEINKASAKAEKLRMERARTSLEL